MAFLSDISAPGWQINTVIWRHRLLLGLALIHLAGGLVVSQYLDEPFYSGTFGIMRTQLKVLIPLFLIVLMFWRFGWMAVTVRPEKPIPYFINDLKRNLWDTDRVLSGTVAFLCVMLFVGTFAFVKDVIPMMVPFSWDPQFAAWDRALHFGYDPWTYTWAIFGTPLATTTINAFYNFWYFLMYFMVFCACYDIRNSRRAATFLTAFILCWVLGGNVAATMFSSVGPVFYEAFGFGDTFVPLMDRLYASQEVLPVWSIYIQELLADGHLNGGPIRGISAMPSMHMGSTVILTLYAFSLRRWLGWIMVGFSTVILIGSVHLAWHYAIDSYLAIAIALGCWWLAKRLVERVPPEAA